MTVTPESAIMMVPRPSRCLARPAAPALAACMHLDSLGALDARAGGLAGRGGRGLA